MNLCNTVNLCEMQIQSIQKPVCYFDWNTYKTIIKVTPYIPASKKKTAFGFQLAVEAKMAFCVMPPTRPLMFSSHAKQAKAAATTLEKQKSESISLQHKLIDLNNYNYQLFQTSEQTRSHTCSIYTWQELYGARSKYDFKQCATKKINYATTNISSNTQKYQLMVLQIHLLKTRPLPEISAQVVSLIKLREEMISKPYG